MNDSSKSSKKDHPRIASSVVPHCSKTMGDISLSKTDRENPEKCKTKVKLHGKNKTAVDTPVDRDQERIADTTGENHPIVSSRHDSERDERVMEMRCTEIQEDAYGIKFVRCNCTARAVLFERCVCLSMISRITAGGKKRSGIQSGRDSGITKGRVTRQLFRSRFTRR